MLRTETATRPPRTAGKSAARKPRAHGLTRAPGVVNAAPATRAHRIHKSKPMVLPTDVSVHEAFARIAIACRDHWDANHGAAIAATDPEGIHQVRVGLRRFRTALTLFRAHLPEAQYAWMKAEAKALGDLLSPARDLDVFIGELAPTARASQSTKAMLRTAKRTRREAQTRVSTALLGARYRRFLTRLNLWLEGSAWRTAEGNAPAQGFARHELNRRLAKIQKRAKTIDAANPEELHDLRIAIKKLRYGLEFFQSLLPPRRAARTGRLLKSLQDSLGQLNDLDVAKRTLETLAAKAGDADARAAVSRAGARLSAKFKPLAKTAQPEAVRIAERLRAQKLF